MAIFDGPVGRLYDYLRLVAAGSWCSSIELELALGVSNRELRMAVQALRRNGVPIMSNTVRGGYQLAVTYEDAETIIEDLDGRAKNMLRTCAAIRRHCAEHLEPRQGRLI